MRNNFETVAKDVVMVYNHPYMYSDLRIDRNTIPDGLVMYEVADDSSDGRFARIANGIMVDFLGTIVGKDVLPLVDGRTYYCKYDEEFDRRRNEFMDELDRQLDKELITDAEYEDKQIDYDESHFADDDDGWFIAHDVEVADYLRNYENYFESIDLKVNEEETRNE